jgi:hypothetical protein
VMSPILVSLTLLALPASSDPVEASPFAQRGYYITFMRMPTYDLADWKKIVDGIHDDGGNTLLLWVAGTFRSKMFPITFPVAEVPSHGYRIGAWTDHPS